MVGSESRKINSKNKYVEKKEKADTYCEVCQKRIRSKYYLQFHMAVHTGEKNFICGICEKGFQQKWNLITHVARIHSKEKPFKCAECEKAFGYSSHFKRHVKTHFLEKIKIPETIKRKILNPHACHQCGKNFESKYRLNRHVKTHTANSSFDCGDSYWKNVTPRKTSEMQIKKGQKKSARFGTKSQEMSFSNNSALDICLKAEQKLFDKRTGDNDELNEERAFEKKGKKNIRCEVCGKVISKESKMKHLNIHFRNRIYCCSFCKKEFLESGQRAIHERKHTGEKPYSCDVCGSQHTQYSNLLTHRKRHHNLTTKPVNLWKRNTAINKKGKENENLLMSNLIQPTCTGNETLEQFQRLTFQWASKTNFLN